MNFAVYKFIFSCSRSLLPNTFLLGDWQFCLPENPCTTRKMNWMPKKVEKVPAVGNLQDNIILTPSRTDLGDDPPFSWVILGKSSVSVVIWNFATGWSYIVWGRELLFHGNSSSEIAAGIWRLQLNPTTLPWCFTSLELNLCRHRRDCVTLSFIFTVDYETLATSLTPELHLIMSEISFILPLSEYIKHPMSLPNIKGDIKGNSNMPT